MLPRIRLLLLSLGSVVLTVAVGAAFLAPQPALAQRVEVRVVTPTPEGQAAPMTPATAPSQGRRAKEAPTSATSKVVTPTSVTPTPTSIPTATATPTTAPVSAVSGDVRLPNGVSVADAYAQALGQASDQLTPGIARTDSPSSANGAMATPTPVSTPQDDVAERRRRAIELGTAQLQPAVELTAFWQELEHRASVRRSATEAAADPALVTALLDVEAETEGSSRTRLAGPGRFRQVTLQEDDDPRDQTTLLKRAAEYIRALHERWQLPELVAAAYVGALDEHGRVTETSAGSLSGAEYVQRFRTAYQRYQSNLGALPSWLVSPFGDLPVSSRMIKFGYLGDYGEALAFEIRGETGVARYGTIHLGLDLQVPGRPDGGRGTPIVAPFDGRVIRTADPVGGPFGIWLENSRLDLRARLMHMDGLVVGIESGVQVKAGQQLGVLGAQGTEGFPHLHLALERMSDGARINPALYYRVRDPSDPQTATDRLPPQQLALESAGRRWSATHLRRAESPAHRSLLNRLLPLEVPSL